jgi:antitoxin CcdA
MTAAKRKISVSLDADLVGELERGDEALSKQVNDAVREAIAARRRGRLLQELLAELEKREGPLPKRLIAKYETLLL